jgi:hypothetical protein
MATGEATAADGDGDGREVGAKRMPATSGGGGGGGGELWAMISFAAAVPSAPQTGQATSEGMRALTGSTSKAYRCPQPHWIFIVIIVGSFSPKVHRVPAAHRKAQRTVYYFASLYENLRASITLQQPCGCPLARGKLTERAMYVVVRAKVDGLCIDTRGLF